MSALYIFKCVCGHLKLLNPGKFFKPGFYDTFLPEGHGEAERKI